MYTAVGLEGMNYVSGAGCNEQHKHSVLEPSALDSRIVASEELIVHWKLCSFGLESEGYMNVEMQHILPVPLAVSKLKMVFWLTD